MSVVLAAGWKINPVMSAMYAPELYTGGVILFFILNTIFEIKVKRRNCGTVKRVNLFSSPNIVLVY